MVYDELGLETIETTTQEDYASPELRRDQRERASAAPSIDERLIRIIKALDR